MDRFAFKLDKRAKAHIYRICRLCGTDSPNKVEILDDVIVVDDDADEPLHRKITTCLGIQVTSDDKMPKTICNLCYDKINDFFEFREMCYSTNAQTRKLLGLAEQPAKIEPKWDPDSNAIIVSGGRKSSTQKVTKNYMPTAVSTTSLKLESAPSPVPSVKYDKKRGRKRKSEITAEQSAVVPPPPNKTIKKEELKNNEYINYSENLDVELINCKSLLSRKDLKLAKRFEKSNKKPESIKKVKQEKADNIKIEKKSSKQFICTVCGGNFLSPALLQNHLIKVHVPTIPRFHCVQCDMSFNTNGAIKTHHSWHKLSRTAYKCGLCSMDVMSSNVLSRHIRECNKQTYSDVVILPNIECKQCREEFQTKNLFSYHNCVTSKLRCPKCCCKLSDQSITLKHIASCSAKPRNEFENSLQKRDQLMLAAADKSSVNTIKPGARAVALKATTTRIPAIRSSPQTITPDKLLSIQAITDVQIQKPLLTQAITNMNRRPSLTMMYGEKQVEIKECMVVIPPGQVEQNPTRLSQQLLPQSTKDSYKKTKQKSSKREQEDTMKRCDELLKNTMQALVSIKYEPIDDDGVRNPQQNNKRIYSDHSHTNIQPTQPMVRIKQEIIDQSYRDNCDIQIKEEPLDHPNLLGNNNNNNKTRVEKSQPVLKLKIKKEHGTLNSSIIENNSKTYVKDKKKRKRSSKGDNESPTLSTPSKLRDQSSPSSISSNTGISPTEITALINPAAIAASKPPTKEINKAKLIVAKTLPIPIQIKDEPIDRDEASTPDFHEDNCDNDLSDNEETNDATQNEIILSKLKNDKPNSNAKPTNPSVVVNSINENIDESKESTPVVKVPKNYTTNEKIAQVNILADKIHVDLENNEKVTEVSPQKITDNDKFDKLFASEKHNRNIKFSEYSNINPANQETQNTNSNDVQNDILPLKLQISSISSGFPLAVSSVSEIQSSIDYKGSENDDMRQTVSHVPHAIEQNKGVLPKISNVSSGLLLPQPELQLSQIELDFNTIVIKKEIDDPGYNHYLESSNLSDVVNASSNYQIESPISDLKFNNTQQELGSYEKLEEINYMVPEQYDYSHLPTDFDFNSVKVKNEIEIDEEQFNDEIQSDNDDDSENFNEPSSVHIDKTSEDKTILVDNSDNLSKSSGNSSKNPKVNSLTKNNQKDIYPNEGGLSILRETPFIEHQIIGNTTEINSYDLNNDYTNSYNDDTLKVQNNDLIENLTNTKWNTNHMSEEQTNESETISNVNSTRISSLIESNSSLQITEASNIAIPVENYHFDVKNEQIAECIEQITNNQTLETESINNESFENNLQTTYTQKIKVPDTDQKVIISNIPQIKIEQSYSLQDPTTIPYNIKIQIGLQNPEEIQSTSKACENFIPLLDSELNQENNNSRNQTAEHSSALNNETGTEQNLTSIKNINEIAENHNNENIEKSLLQDNSLVQDNDINFDSSNSESDNITARQDGNIILNNSEIIQTQNNIQCLETKTQYSNQNILPFEHKINSELISPASSSMESQSSSSALNIQHLECIENCQNIKQIENMNNCQFAETNQNEAKNNFIQKNNLTINNESNYTKINNNDIPGISHLPSEPQSRLQHQSQVLIDEDIEMRNAEEEVILSENQEKIKD